MKTIYKMVLILIILMFFIPCNNSYAAKKTKGKAGDISSWQSKASQNIAADTNVVKENLQNDENGLKDIISKILGFMQVTAGLIIVVTIAITGFDYIVQTPNKVAHDISKRALPIIIGTVCLFGAVSIAKVFISVGGG